MNGVSKSVKADNYVVSMEKRKLVVPDMSGAGTVFAETDGLFSYDVKNAKSTELLSGRNNIALLKVDFKGCELELFKQSLKEISKKARCIIVDAGRISSGQREEIESDLQDAGFSLDSGPKESLYLENTGLLMKE